MEHPTYYVVYRTCGGNKSYYGFNTKHRDPERWGYSFGLGKKDAHPYSTKRGAMTAARNFSRKADNGGWIFPLWYEYGVEEWRYDRDGKED